MTPSDNVYKTIILSLTGKDVDEVDVRIQGFINPADIAATLGYDYNSATMVSSRKKVAVPRFNSLPNEFPTDCIKIRQKGKVRPVRGGSVFVIPDTSAYEKMVERVCIWLDEVFNV